MTLWDVTTGFEATTKTLTTGDTEKPQGRARDSWEKIKKAVTLVML